MMNYYVKPISYELFGWNMSYEALFQVSKELKSRRGLAYRSNISQLYHVRRDLSCNVK